MKVQTLMPPMTAEAFLDWVHLPENANRYFELVKEGVIELLPPGEPHNTVASLIIYILMQYAFAQGKGRVSGTDTGIVLSRNPDVVRGPDVVYFSRSLTFDELPETYSDEVPSLTVEVVSPTDRATAVQKKVQDYLASGVSLVWVVYPQDRSVIVHKRGCEPTILEGDENLDGNGILPGFACKVSDFFRLPGAK